MCAVDGAGIHTRLSSALLRVCRAHGSGMSEVFIDSRAEMKKGSGAAVRMPAQRAAKPPSETPPVGIPIPHPRPSPCANLPAHHPGTMILDDEDTPPNPLKAFDAFPKVHQSYVHSRSSRGGIVTLTLLAVVALLAWTEMYTWWKGAEVMSASVENGIGHGIQINVDITVAMNCEGTSKTTKRWPGCALMCPDVDVNVLDATGDRILAGEELKKEAVRQLTPSNTS